MAKLLYIEASPRKDRSSSIKVARAFVDEYRRAHPEDTVDVLDLWDVDLPVFDGDTINTKYAILHGDEKTPEQVAAWRPVEEAIERFTSADKYLFSLPMWNFGIPYKLKHFIDVLIQPTYTFSFTPEEGYKGLVTGKPAMLVYARGGAYSQGTGAEAMDFQKSYLELVLGFIGFEDMGAIVIEPTLMVTHEEKNQMVKQATEDAVKAAASF
jgi:FMN-dependent NADH-azoreductase